MSFLAVFFTLFFLSYIVWAQSPVWKTSRI